MYAYSEKCRPGTGKYSSVYTESSQSAATVILPCNERLPHQECGASYTTGPAHRVTADQWEVCALHL